jgi:hypothetical protein
VNQLPYLLPWVRVLFLIRSVSGTRPSNLGGLSITSDAVTVLLPPATSQQTVKDRAL